MTQPREWPNNARWARDDVAQELQQIIRKARLLQKHDDLSVVAAAGLVIDRAQRAMRYLVEVGATMPEDKL